MSVFDKCEPCRKPAPFGKGRARMPDIERPEFCRTQNKQSVHKPRNGDSAGLAVMAEMAQCGGRTFV